MAFSTAFFSNTTSRSATEVLRQSNTTAIPWWITHNTDLFTWATVTFAFYLLCAIIYPFLPFVLILLKEYQRPSGILILHLVCLEASLALVLVPLQLAGNYVGQYNLFKSTDCVYSKFIFQVVMQTANWSQLFLGINRLIAATSRKLYMLCTTKAALSMTIGISWLIGIINTLPTVLDIEGNYIIVPPWNNCGFQSKPGTPFMRFVIIGMYIPLPCTVLVYIVLLWRFRRMRATVEGALATNAAQHNSVFEGNRKRRIRIGRMLFAATMWYCVCYCTLTLMGAFMRPSYQKEHALLWGQTLYFAAYSMTPVVFFAMNREYRAKLVQVLKCVRNSILI
ncbi:uncharacterized protein LOC129590047 [Paramacrobiotus metropolitanus]|uniref:uncharacterized protein LOC129590047 n=1 Tax=Paramacrobiotus metropolitanus TaxID=2943436 RepID=UPI0024458432|nr:uncharacterized protein LOC129590047 [Paramacrobiotus metropolitanus]XP_055340997.1 uncharacterized protein LOC129590047 [Paramacrobiotus metropolitanus]